MKNCVSILFLTLGFHICTYGQVVNEDFVSAIYPGCEKEIDNGHRKKCMAKKIALFTYGKFNTKILCDIGVEGFERIGVVFKVNTEGDVVDVQARSKYDSVKEECIRVIKLLPKITPAKKSGNAVDFPFALPIKMRCLGNVDKG
ncbi:MAG: hypothetical protein ACON5F_12050 [Jejuia sp.]